MRYPAAETAAKHEAILSEGSRLFRQHGFAGVTLGEIMKATGLTHGPFYNHFASKEELMIECIRAASDKAIEELDGVPRNVNGKRAYLGGYLEEVHRDNASDGCLIAALGPEIARQPKLKSAFTDHVVRTIERFAAYFPWKSRASRRRESLLALSAIVGAIVLARAVDDPSLSAEILRDVKSSLA